ncbi:MAG: TolB-like 6-bladed beta-propeller domain-containing protein [Tannerella sp.]|nr:TolB-like 6-bladed beta-propeller domain-containing protein [Tannerella sp.]
MFVFSWDGKPLKRYLLAQPIYCFTIDEARQTVYAYSPETEELIKGNL